MIEVIVGPMFAGKTEALLDEIEKCEEINYRVFKPACDTRDGTDKIVSHDGQAHGATPVQTAGDILRLVDDVRTVFIDEVQFFGPAILSVCRELEKRGVRVVCSGLDMDSNRLPFGCIGDLLAMAGKVTKLTSRCAICGRPAQYSFRYAPVKDKVFVGGGNEYAPKCGNCWE